MNILEWAVESTREKGVVQTVKIAGNFVMDLSFDWKHGTDTMGWVEREALGARSGNQEHSAPYKATKARPFLNLLSKLDLPRDCTFVDIGSGKGRALLIASQYGFRKVTGIEFSGHFCALARRNAESFARNKGMLSPIEVIEADATSHHFQAEDRVFFMYNPFDSFILAQVMDNIGHSLKESPRGIWLIYNTPLHHEVIKKAGLFKSDSFHEIGGNHFRVYAN